MSSANPKVDGFMRKSNQWRDELQALRTILLDSPLTEEVKWRFPCYTFQERNVVLLGRFKDYCVLSFVKGALLKDTRRILIQPGENTQSARVIRFTDVRQITELKPVLKQYIREAIEVEKAGLKVKFKAVAEFPIPTEFKDKLDANPRLKKAFAALTPGRQRGYILHFSSAKQSKTRAARVEKHMQQILDGKGLDDD